MSNVNITSPASNTTLSNRQIPVQGTVEQSGDPVTLSLYQNNQPVNGQQNRNAAVSGTHFSYTFMNVTPGSGYSVTASDGGRVNTVSNLTVTS